MRQLVRQWLKLRRRAKAMEQPDVVVVGYLGQFDVHLARRLFPKATIVLDYMVSMGGTVRDRGVGGRAVAAVLDVIDAAALRAADVVVVDTPEHIDTLGAAAAKAVVVPVGAPDAWFTHREPAVAPPAVPPVVPAPLRVVFFGLYTPLQGAPTVGAAMARLAGTASFTMIGDGQDRAATEAAAGPDVDLEWIDWLDEEALPGVVAAHDVCLGIFGTTAKAGRVIPNKVFQGMAAGCAVVTSDTECQRRMLGDAVDYVEPGNGAALARALETLAQDCELLGRRRTAAALAAAQSFTPAAVVEPLLSLLEARLCTSP